VSEPWPGAAVFTDPRGTLTQVSLEQIPFAPARVYVLHTMPVGAKRGGRAARRQRRVLVGISGSLSIVLDDGRETRDLRLQPGDMLPIEPGVWHELSIEEEHTAVLVFASGPYDPDDYVADRSQLPLSES
jgi:UDP-2-acetamido-3-amino-2,3-dideoxy-glucuronate N-acetyltransferase